MVRKVLTCFVDLTVKTIKNTPMFHEDTTKQEWNLHLHKPWRRSTLTVMTWLAQRGFRIPTIHPQLVKGYTRTERRFREFRLGLRQSHQHIQAHLHSVDEDTLAAHLQCECRMKNKVKCFDAFTFIKLFQSVSQSWKQTPLPTSPNHLLSLSHSPPDS